MSLQTWQETLISSQIDGTAVTTTTPGTSLLPPAAVLTLPANYFQIGKVLRLNMFGRIGNRNASTDTITFNLKFGATVVAASQAIPLNAIGKTTVPFWLQWLLTCRSIGNSALATMMHQGIFHSETVIGAPAVAAGGGGIMQIPAGAPAVGTGFDSTVALTVDLFAFWNAANASNTMLSHQYILEALN